jgi:pimeloyl-ACP methyl ester carboxylesterase
MATLTRRGLLASVGAGAAGLITGHTALSAKSPDFAEIKPTPHAPAIAFLHGGGQGSWVWERTIAAITEQSLHLVRCLALDVPGCGTKRERDTSAIAFDDIARELIRDMEADGLRDAILVGHSRGGMLIPRIVEFAPKLFRGLIYISCSAPPPGATFGEARRVTVPSVNPVGSPSVVGAAPSLDQQAAMFCNDMTPPERDAFLTRLGEDFWPKSSETYRGWRYDHLGAIPAVFVHCMRDQAVPPEWQRRFAETFRADRTVHIDAGHQAMITRPQALAEVLLAELAA